MTFAATQTVGVAGSLFERCGGFPAVRKVIIDFYDRVLDSDVVGHHFDNVDMNRLVDHQTKFVSALAGGPMPINDERLARAHTMLAITHEEFDEIGRLLANSLDAAGIPRRDSAEIMNAVEARRRFIVRSERKS